MLARLRFFVRHAWQQQLLPQHAIQSLIMPTPLTGHCAAVAYMVQASFGGDIVTGRITNRIKNHYWNKVTHYWNRLPDGTEIDLTSCQFGGDGLTPFKKGRKVKRGDLVPIRFLLFAAKVYKIVNGEAT